MQTHHWLMLILTVFIGYMLGVYFPGFGSKVRGTIGV